MWKRQFGSDLVLACAKLYDPRRLQILEKSTGRQFNYNVEHWREVRHEPSCSDVTGSKSTTLNTMNVKELIEWLKSQDQDATVRVIGVKEGDYYTQAGVPKAVDFDPDEYSEYTDFRENPFVKDGDPRKEKRTLTLGEIL